MDKTDTKADHDPSVRELLIETLNSKSIGYGHSSTVYAFHNFPAMDNYVLRVKTSVIPKLKDYLKDLNNTTSLTPLKYIMSRLHVGQPLMEMQGFDSDDVTVLRKQPGENLLDMHERFARETKNRYPTFTATAKMAEFFLELNQTQGTNPFLDIFRQGYEVSRSGGYFNLSPANMVFDPADNQLHLVDQTVQRFRKLDSHESVQRSVRMEADTFFSWFVDHLETEDEDKLPGINTVLGKRHEDSIEAASALIREAARQVIAEHTMNPGASKGIRFAKINDVSAAAIQIDARSSKLVRELDQLTKKANIPTR